MTSRPEWKALVAHYEKVRGVHLRELFADDPLRGERLTAEAAGIFLDYSKHHVTADTLRLLLETAAQGILSVDAAGLIVMANAATEKMFGWRHGELIGQSVEQLVPRSLQDRHVAHRAAYFRAPQARLMSGMDLLGQRKDGSTFPIELSLNHAATADGRVRVVVSVLFRHRARARRLRQEPA